MDHALAAARTPYEYPFADTADAVSVLILSPDPVVHGGVSTFIEMLKPRLRRCRIESLWVGSRHNRPETGADLFRRVFGTPLHLFRLVRRRHFDVVHINPSLSMKSAVRDSLLMLALRLAGFRNVLVFFHGWQGTMERRIQRNPVLRHLCAWLLNGAAHIMVLSPEFKQALQKIGVDGNKITFARTMFDGAALRPGFDGAALRPGLDGAALYPDVTVVQNTTTRRSVLFMSRFDRAKGVHELIEAFARVAADFPDTDLVMAGAGAEEAALKARVEQHNLTGRVLFPGYIGGDAKMALLRDCTIFALPTYFPEGMPVALIEAMGAGKPLLTAKAGAIPYIIRQPDNGVVLDHVSAETVETALRRLLGDAPYCRETGQRNAAYAWQRFEADIVTAEIEALYRTLAGKL